MIDITYVMKYVLPVIFKGKDGDIYFESMYKTHIKHFHQEFLFEYPYRPSEIDKLLKFYSFIEFDIGTDSDIKPCEDCPEGQECSYEEGLCALAR